MVVLLDIFVRWLNEFRALGCLARCGTVLFAFFDILWISWPACSVVTGALRFQGTPESSAAVVQFRPVLDQYYSNLGPNYGLVLSGSLNLGPDHREQFNVVRFGFRTGSNHEPINFYSKSTK